MSECVVLGIIAAGSGALAGFFAYRLAMKTIECQHLAKMKDHPQQGEIK